MDELLSSATSNVPNRRQDNGQYTAPTSPGSVVRPDPHEFNSALSFATRKPVHRTLAPPRRSSSMGKQNERFSEPEKEWLESQYQRDDVQKILARGPTESILKDAAKLLYEDYAAAFSQPIPEESEESYKRRRKNAKKDRKPFITRRPAETADQVKPRLDDAVAVSKFTSLCGA